MTSDSSDDKVAWPYDNSIPPPYGPLPDRLVGDRYELLDLIGWGATSRIYRAQDRRLHRTVAIKLLRPEYVQEPNLVTRFYREAQAVASLSNPHIVDVYDYGEYQDTYFIAMQYIAGTNLKEFLHREGRLPGAKAVSIINQVLLALGAAHSLGIIHRDVKPQNILIQASDGMVKLTDFGVAHAPDNSSITTLGTAIGTVFYMSPEQATGGKIGPATDLYSVGIVLYEMLAGELPFQGTNQMQVTLQHLQNLPPTFSSLGVEVSPKLERVVERALAKDPSQRYQSANEMRMALSEALKPVPKAAPVRPVEPPRLGSPGVSNYQATARESLGYNVMRQPTPSRRWLPLLAGLILLILVAGVGWLGLSLLSKPADKSASTPIGSITDRATTEVATSLPTATAAPIANPVVPAQPPTEAPANTQVASSFPTVTPLPTITPLPSDPSAQTGKPATTVRVSTPNTQSGGGSAVIAVINPDGLDKAYKRDDRTLYGRPEVALYGNGTGYDQAITTFKLDKLTDTRMLLRITGLDDEREERCNLRVTLNGTIIFDGPDSFPQVPNGDIGEGGQSRYWGQQEISIPPNVLKVGSNSLVVQNTTPSPTIGIPYILINTIELIAA